MAGGGLVDATSAKGPLVAALPGEWAALFVTLAVIAAVGAAILVATCLRHERVVRRRYVRRRSRAGRESVAGVVGRVARSETDVAKLPVLGERHSLGA